MHTQAAAAAVYFNKFYFFKNDSMVDRGGNTQASDLSLCSFTIIFLFLLKSSHSDRSEMILCCGFDVECRHLN